MISNGKHKIEILNEQAKSILNEMTLSKVMAYVGLDDGCISTAMTHFLQNVINSLSGLEQIKKDRERHEAARKADPAARMRPFPFCFEKIGERMMTTMMMMFMIMTMTVMLVKR